MPGINNSFTFLKIKIIMKKWSLGFLMVFALLYAACEKDNNTTPDVIDDSVSNKQKATEVLTGLVNGDTSAIIKYVDANSYTHHNAALAVGQAALIEAVLSGHFDNRAIDIKRVLAETDMVALHSLYIINGAPMVGFDVFSFQRWADRRALG